jgi:ribosome-binding protein aMBF1 (putative translation factor)
MATETFKLLEINVQSFIEVKNAFDECCEEVQAVILDMLNIYNNPDSTEQEKQLALHTVIDGLFPASCEDLLEHERKVASDGDAEAFREEMDAEETAFGDRVRHYLKSKGMTQTDLANEIGIKQPAVAMLLNRECRPQRQTVVRIAQALDVDANELWPHTKTGSKPAKSTQ